MPCLSSNYVCIYMVGSASGLGHLLVNLIEQMPPQRHLLSSAPNAYITTGRDGISFHHLIYRGDHARPEDKARTQCQRDIISTMRFEPGSIKNESKGQLVNSHLIHYAMYPNNCCVFWPAFKCCAHPKAGWKTFLLAVFTHFIIFRTNQLYNDNITNTWWMLKGPPANHRD